MAEATLSASDLSQPRPVARPRWPRRARRAAALLLALSLPPDPDLLAEDVSDATAAIRKLRSRTQARALRQGDIAPRTSALATLAQRDEGQIVIMEHDGSDYSKDEPDGTPNYTPRTEIARRFYETHGDNYDFLVVFTNFEFSSGNAQAFHNQVRNDVAGIGRPPLDVGDWFGSPGRLKAYIDMAALERYTRPPWSLTPGDPGYFWTLSTLAHEVAHQWLSFASYQRGPDRLGDLRGVDDVHWSYLLDTDASHMYGSDWVQQPDGRWLAARIRDGFSPLDRYLMGFLARDKVEPFTLLRNPAIEPRQLPLEGDLIEAVRESVEVQQVVAAEGPRQPDHLASPKEFRIAFIFLTAPGTEVTAQDLAIVERIRQAFAGFFFAQTAGVAVADTTLAEAPAPPSAPTPNLDLALAWLLSRQTTEGSWSDTTATTPRDTAAALVALSQTGQTGAPYQAGRLWLGGTLPGNTDFLSRRALALATAPLGAPDQEALAAAIEGLRNPDGGFGPTRGYASDPLDTALALRALRALGRPAGPAVTEAVAALAAHRDPSGGWAMVPGGEVSTVVTAEALIALLEWRELPAAQALVAGALLALEARRNPDGGFGESPSTPYATALALTALARAGSPASSLDPALSWLQGHQREDGSWGGSRYETALVLGALKGGIAPNLVIPADSLVLDPPVAHEGDTVQVSLRVANTGRGLAAASQVRLYDGPPGPGNAIDQALVPPLAPGADATITLSYPTQDRAGQRVLYVVADADGDVAEAREDDNAASRALTVQGRLPDLALDAAAIAVVPFPPARGETVEVRVTVANRGEKASEPSAVRLFLGDPQHGGQGIGLAALPPVPQGSSLTLTFFWDTTGLETGEKTLFALADSDFALQESDETNNQAWLTVPLLPEAPPEPELEAVSLVTEPQYFSRIPQDVTVHVVVRNRGLKGVNTSVALFDTDPPSGPPLAEQPVHLGPRSTATVTFTYRVTGSGSRNLVARADPDNKVVEDDEDNNEARGLLVDSESDVDLELLADEVETSPTSPSELTVGEVLTVTARVHNRGTAEVRSAPIVLFHSGPSGPVELTRSIVNLEPGAETTVTLEWTTALTGELALLLRADPFEALPELSETNNEVALAVTVRPSTEPNLETNGGLFRVEPSPLLQGGSATLFLEVRNPSVVDAGPFQVAFYRGDPDDDGAPIGSVSLAGVPAGQSVTASLAWLSVDLRNVPGLFAVVDTGNEVEEYDETDNRAFLAVGAVGYADLVLTAGDVSLDPAFPRAGQAVTVQAVVRNLGQRAAPESQLRALEGEPGSLITEVPVPALAAGQSTVVTFTWTPSAPGERRLSLQVDPANTITEADEGNNLARRTVVAQNADLYLTATYFSPDGDGVQDETVLAYRATGSVSVVVSNARGKKVRTLVERGQAEDSVAWDGRGEGGRILPDGVYTFTVQGERGTVLGRASATLDTNRVPIHEAAGTKRIATRNLTCALDGTEGPAFMPSEEEALVIVSQANDPEIPVGLVRLSLDGTATYLFQEGRYEGTTFSGPGAVSPDGREVLVVTNGGSEVTAELFAVDLQSGEWRLVDTANDSYYYPGYSVAWSPDGQYLVAQGHILSRDGTYLGNLGPWEGWTWSPDGRFLARGNRIVSRDLTEDREIDFPFSIRSVLQTNWLPDGRIFTRFRGRGEDEDVFALQQGSAKSAAKEATPTAPQAAADGGVPMPTPLESPSPECDDSCSFFIDPITEEVQSVPWLDDRAESGQQVSWSPVGDRVLYSRYKPRLERRVAEVAREDGGAALELVRREVEVSPRGRLGWVYTNEGLPGAACLGSDAPDLYVFQSLDNLSAAFTAARLPGNNGLLLRGTVSDRHLDRWQLEYTPTSDPEGWRPIGPAYEVPIYNDVLAAWAPAQPGTYAVRLSVRDRAGNVKNRVRVIAWDRVPAIANVSQSEFLISPNADGVKDEVLFNYLVQEPVRLEVRILGPLSDEEDAPPPPVVRAFGFDYPELGPQAFAWDGRDEGGQVAPDGRYTVDLNGLPFRVDVDATPPDIALAWANVRTEVESEIGGNSFGVLKGDRQWHVVDQNLKSWQADLVPEQTPLLGDDQVFEPLRDDEGEIVYVDGLPQIKRQGSRAADRVDPEYSIASLGVHPGSTLSATDHAGNVTVIPVPPVPEKIYVLQARDYVSFLAEPTDDRGEQFRNLMLPPIGERDEAGQEVIKHFVPHTDFDLSETLRGTPKEGETYHFQFQRRAGGPWTDSPELRGSNRLDFGALGLDFGDTYRGRFSCDAQNGAFLSESFLFRPCEDYMRLVVQEKPEPELSRLVVENGAIEPLASGKVSLLTADAKFIKLPDGREARGLPMVPDGLGGLYWEVPPKVAPCTVLVEATGESGKVYGHDGRCRLLRLDFCGSGGGVTYRLLQDEQLCGDPTVLRFGVWDFAGGRTFRVEGDPDGEPFPVTSFEGQGGIAGTVHPVLVDVSGIEKDRDLTFRISVDHEEGEQDIPEQRLTLHVDKTAPLAEILSPPEGAALCVSADGVTGRESVSFVVRAQDYSPRIKVTAELRNEEGRWRTVAILCPGGAPCENPDVIRQNQITELPIDITGFPSGDYTARFTFCDAAGNKSRVERTISLNREPPYLRLVGLDRSIFSPNGDGKSDTVTATFNLAQALTVNAVVRREGPSGPVIRTLFASVTFPAGNQALTWDGRGAGGAALQDGPYWIELSGLDPCGRQGRVGVKVMLDVTPPATSIVTPPNGGFVLGSTDVTGWAADLHFAGWTLEVAPAAGLFEVIGERGSAVGAPGIPGRFGRWDAPPEVGPYDLRLTARDLAENESPPVIVRVQVVPRSRLESLAAEPDLFSPNGDGRLETTTVTYELSNPGRVFLDIRTRGGVPVRVLEAGAERPAGPHAHFWDGRAATGEEAPDGEYDVKIRVEDPFDLTPSEEATVTVEVDRRAPDLTLYAPPAGAFVDRERTIDGSALDRNITAWTLAATPTGGAAVELVSGAQDQPPAELATLSLLGEGPHVARLAAADRAENRSQRDLAFTVDSIPPVVVIHAPAPASIWPKTAPVTVTGTATDANLLRWTLTAGPGSDPPYFFPVRTDVLGGEGIPVGPWNVGALPDGDYTLRLEGEDKAGHHEEARVTVAVDGTPPVAEITLPEEGGYVNSPRPVLGIATDLHLDSWSLEVAGGDAASAYEWTPLGSGTSEVENDQLAQWNPLPPDGVYTLRLTVHDKAGLSSTALRTVIVDTTPPSPPRPKGKVIKKGGPTADILVTWDPVPEPDVEGYTIARGEDELRGLDPQLSYLDVDRVDGIYIYSVVAEDFAGNQSDPGTARVPVDLTPPIADILLPREGASVSGSVDITGTAWSADDFKEYRLFVGKGASPTSFTLLRRSTLPVLAATLGDWNALGDGPHVIALEAEDTSENVARVTRNVVVDNQPPGPPVMVSVARVPDPQSLRSTWEPGPNPAPDVIGYLLYRNGSIANAEGVVLGDLTPFLITELTYLDPELPDGKHCYHVVAMDRAGNLSSPSDELCETLENRAPHAEIVQPSDGLRFEFPIEVVAVTPDLDVVSVQFQYKASAEPDSSWAALGALDTGEPWQVTFDPVALDLDFGYYDLRAVARDATKVDPDPTFITVIYGDTTKPAVPIALQARVDARTVHLTWTANTEDDLAGYNLYRDGEPLAFGLVDPAYDDDRDPGTYRYTVTAVDHDFNESRPSEEATAVVYALSLVQPFPVTLETTLTLSGDGALPDTTVELFEDGDPVASLAADASAFEVPAVPIAPEGNFFTARGRDALDNKSIRSNEVVIIGNTAPAAVTSLVASPSPTSKSVDLTWDVSPEPDLFGYAVRRDGEAVTGSSLATDGQASANSVFCTFFYGCQYPWRAIDGDPSTQWVPEYYTASEHYWTVQFPAPVLVEKVKLSFAYYYGYPAVAQGYRIEALWQDRWVPLAEVKENSQTEVEHTFPTAFSTDSLRVAIQVDYYLGLSEVEITKSDLVPAATPAFSDPGAVKDGDHVWEVAAVDRYGAYGPWAPVTFAVDRLSKPTGLVGVAEGSDAVLTWNPNPEPDIAYYNVFRYGELIGTAPASPSPTYRDSGLPNALYVYTVSAVDNDGNESEPSDPASVLIDVQPPQAPVLRAVATPRGHVDLEWDHPGASVYLLYRSLASGGPYTLLTETPERAFTDVTATLNVENFYVVVAKDDFGNPSPASNEASAIPRRTRVPDAPVILFPTDAAHPIALRATRTPVRGRTDPDTEVVLQVNGEERGRVPSAGIFAEQGTTPVSPEAFNEQLSPDGRFLAYSRYDPATGFYVAVLQDLASGEVRELNSGPYSYVYPLAFAPAGGRLLVSASGDLADGYHYDLVAIDLQTGEHTAVETGEGLAYEGSWSADGTRVAYATASYFTPCQLLVTTLGSGIASPVNHGNGCPREPRFSPTGDRISFWSDFSYQGRVADLSTTAAPQFVDTPVYSALSWSPSGQQVSYSQGFYPSRVRVYDIASRTRREITDGSSHATQPLFDPLGRWLSYLADGPEGLRVFAHDLAEEEAVDVAPAPDFRHAAWTATGYLGVVQYSTLSVYPGFEGSFELPDVPLAIGDNVLVARAEDVAAGLTSPDSLPVTITVPEDAFADLAVTGVFSSPPVPRPGQAAQLVARIENLGGASVHDVEVRVRLADAAGQLLVNTTLTVPLIEADDSTTVAVPWLPVTAGLHQALVEADPQETVHETREDNNALGARIQVLAVAGIVASIEADRDLYGAHAPALVTVRVVNGSTPFTGTARTVVEDPEGHEVALLDERPLVLVYGQEANYELPWNTGTTYAGEYRFRLRLRDAGGAALPPAEDAFQIAPDVRAAARLVADAAAVPLGMVAGFAGTVESRSVNTILTGLSARFAIRPEGTSGPASFETDVALPALLPSGIWQGPVAWPGAAPAGRYTAELRVLRGAETLALATAPFEVTAAARLAGTIAAVPDHVLAGDAFEARIEVRNLTPSALTALPVLVDVVSGTTAAVSLSQTLTLDFAPAEVKTAILPFSSATLAPGRYTARLRVGDPAQTLARASLRVHGIITPPSIHAPADGSTVGTPHPSLVVNNATSAEGAPLTYEYQLYFDSGLTAPLPGITGAPEMPARTSWRVLTSLGEDQTYWWRARATDGFSTSDWSAVASFRLDSVNLPPDAPIPLSPAPGDRVASRQPKLVVLNARDPENDVLTYEFRLAEDPAMTTVVTSTAGVAEGDGFTEWPLPVLLDEDKTYCWNARASDGQGLSPWSVPACFLVDTVNLPPTAPVPLRPVGGVSVPTLTPELAVGPAHDPEEAPLAYFIELDRSPGFDSAERQASPALGEISGEAAWIPPVPLTDDTLYHWRAAASDGVSRGPWAYETFFVNLGNEPPTAPVPQSPVGGAAVHTLNPELRVRNSTDPDGDALTYEFVLFDAAGSEVARMAGVAQGVAETGWTTTNLGEDLLYQWQARAHDGQVAGEWSGLETFRVKVAPSAPGLVAPPEGSTVDTRRPALVISNATSPRGLSLTYSFELYTDPPAPGLPQLVDRVGAQPEGTPTTTWTAGVDLADGPYSWRARAFDGTFYGPWMASARFKVAVDLPPAPPTGLAAVPGDRRVDLTWNASPEPDVIGYRVYRSLTARGPYERIASPTVPSYPDTGLMNGVTYYYVVTARDARFESGYSNEAAATPKAPTSTLPAQVGFDPTRIQGECLLSRCRDCEDTDDHDDHAHEDLVSHMNTSSGGGSSGSVRPVLDCVVENDDDDGFTALFGYKNDSSKSVTVGVGSQNMFSPSPKDRGQPTVFPPGQTAYLYGAFPVDFTSNELSWTVQGRTATASCNSKRCSPPTPSVDCPEWLTATIELPVGYDPATIDRKSVRLAGTVLADKKASITDRDHDGLKELEVRFSFADVAALLAPGLNTLSVTGRAGGVEFAGKATVEVAGLQVGMFVSPRKLKRSSSHGSDLEVQLRVPDCMDAKLIDTSSLRLGDTVKVKKVVSVSRQQLIVKFDRQKALAVLPSGSRVEVRVGGTLSSRPFVSRDYIKVE